jgi:hypothetical protein
MPILPPVPLRTQRTQSLSIELTQNTSAVQRRTEVGQKLSPPPPTMPVEHRSCSLAPMFNISQIIG